jgi:polyhydroxyalkanoate synthesis regulator phasin
MKATIISGFTAVLLGTATATTALAQNDARYGNGPAESTPSEMQQTGQLNQQSGNAAAADLARQSQEHAQYQDQQQQYQLRLHDYQTQQQGYDEQRQR